MRKIYYLSIILLLGYLVPAFAQQHNYANTFAQLELQLQKGDKRALKGIGMFLDDRRQFKDSNGNQTTLHQVALSLLSQYTLFAQQEFTFNRQTTRTAFLKFYLQQENTWVFSDFLQIFSLTSLDKIPSKYRIKPYLRVSPANKKVLFKHYRKEFLQALSLKLYDQIPEIIERIARLKLPEAFRLLRQCINGRYWKITATNTFAMRLYEAACYALRHYSSIEAARLIIKAVKEEKTYLQGAVEALSYITNIHPKALHDKSNSIVSVYNRLMLQYPTIGKLRDKGYQHFFDYDRIHFQHQVDYYGTILNKAYHYFWIRYNAIQDLKQQRNSKALWYLAAQVFQKKGQARYNWQADIRPLEILQKLTEVEVQVTNAQGQWTTNLSDAVAKLNFVKYWHKHYQDYTWDKTSKRFVNQQVTSVMSAQDVDFHKQFRRLHSLDQNVAVIAFRKLADKQPEQTLNLLPKQKKIIFPRSYQLPIYPYLSLSVLIQLRVFCQNNRLDYLPYLNDVLSKLRPLESHLPQAKRIALEQELLRSVDFYNVTALEYWAIVKENASWRLGYSLGNVLNQFYNQKKTSLLESPKHLRLFLKKCALFSRLRPKGLGAKYMSFLKDINEEERQVLDKIWEKEQDQDIKVIIAQANCHPLFNLHEAFTLFVANPHAQKWQELRELRVCSPQDFSKVVSQIKRFQNPEKIHWLLYWLKQQKSLESVPYLMQLINDQRVIGQHQGFQQYIPLTVSDEVVFLLEQIYHHSFIDEKDFYKTKPRNVYRFSKNIQPWKQKWKKDGQRFRSWETDFFKQRLFNVAKQSQINVNALNNIMLSPLFKPDTLKYLLLKAVPKVSTVSDIAYLKWRLPLKVDDLIFFKKGFSQTKLLARIIPLIEARPAVVLNFINRVSTRFPKNVQAKLYLELGYTTRLWQWLADMPQHPLKKRVIKAIQLFKSIEEYQSSRYETEATLFLLVNNDVPLTKKISKVKKVSNKDLQFEILSQMVQQVRYNEVLALLNNLPRLRYVTQYFDALNTEIKHHLRYNLGLPLNDTQDLTSPSLRKDLKDLKEQRFREKYLSKWFPLLIDAAKTSDFIYLQTTLKYALIYPLAGIGKNDYRLYSVLGFFQNHFKTQLGFPDNMYSAQNWDRPITIQKWQKYWQSFLREKSSLTNRKAEKY